MPLKSINKSKYEYAALKDNYIVYLELYVCLQIFNAVEFRNKQYLVKYQ